MTQNVTSKEIKKATSQVSSQNKCNNNMHNKTLKNNKINKKGIEMTMSNVIGLALIFLLIIAIIAFLLQGESSIGKLIKQIFG